ncbi:MAG: toprim domain-containing protein [Cellulomonas sp.]
MVDTQSAREFDAATGPVAPARIAQLNQLAADFYAQQLPGSWAQAHLRQRLGADLNEHTIQAGYAPAGWTRLVDHLRRHGATDLELTEAGLATVARTGRLIDRFRDRLVLPITRQTATGPQTLGFVGRRNPETPDQTDGPKYLNTPDTALFHKGAQLFTVGADLLASGATPVLVEGPMDALAVTLAGNGTYAGVAPLGTSLTEEQAAEVARFGARTSTAPIVATDADLAGQMAAQRDYWLLSQHALAPTAASLRPGSDPASVLETEGPEALRTALSGSQPLAQIVIRERLDNLTGLDAAREAARVLAADEPGSWGPGCEHVARESGVPEVVVRRELARALQQWEHDPRSIVAESIGTLTTVRHRIASQTTDPVHQPAPKPTQPAPTAPLERPVTRIR